MISCIYPDCTETFKDKNPEKAKRLCVSHINESHAEGHVLIACAHDMREVERFIAKTISGETGQPLEFPQVKSQCVRCGDFEITDAPSAGVVDGGEAADDVTVTDGG